MKQSWLVITPEYEAYPGCAYSDPPEPPEYGCDVVDVDDAQNAREAKVLGVQEMRRRNRKNWRDCQWIADQQTNGASPFTGLKAEQVPDEGNT